MKKLLIALCLLFTISTELVKPYSDQEISYLTEAVPAYVLEKGTLLNHSDFNATFPALQGIVDEIKRDRSTAITETFATIAATIGSKSKAPMEVAAGLLYYFGVMANSHKNICMLLTVVQAIHELQAQQQSIRFSVIMEAAEALALKFGGKPNFTNLITNAKPSHSNDLASIPENNKKIIKVAAIGVAILAVIFVILSIYNEQEKELRKEKRKLDDCINRVIGLQYANSELREAIGLAGEATKDVLRKLELLKQDELEKLGKVQVWEELNNEIGQIRREHANINSAIVNIHHRLEPQAVEKAINANIKPL